MAEGFKRSLLGACALVLACSTIDDELPAPSAPFASSSGFTSSASSTGNVGGLIDQGTCSTESCPGLCALSHCCDDDHVFCNDRGNPVCCPPGWRCIDHACVGTTILPSFDAGVCGDEPDPAIAILGGPCDVPALEVSNVGGGTAPAGLVIEVRETPDAGSVLVVTPRPLIAHESVSLRTKVGEFAGARLIAEIVDAGAGNCDAGNDTAQSGTVGMKECL